MKFPNPIIKNRGTILIVEDNSINRNVLSEILTNKGYCVIEAINGIKGVEEAERNPELMLILMDIHMPFMDGLEATNIIRNQNKNIPIIALTADITEETKKLCKDIGMTDYLNKPIIPKKLFDKIEKYSNTKIEQEQEPNIESKIEQEQEPKIESKIESDIVKKVLVVDDNYINRIVFEGLFNGMNFSNYDIEIHNSGGWIIDGFKKGVYSIIILDIEMPDIDGITIAKKIREIDNKQYIVSMSGNEIFNNKLFNKSVTKPIRKDYITSIINDYEDYIKESLINIKILKDISIIGKTYILKGVDTWYKSVEKSINTFKNETNLNKLRSIAHKMRGGSYQLGVSKIGDIYSEIEENVLDGDIKYINKLIKEIENIYKKTNKQLIDACNNLEYI